MAPPHPPRDLAITVPHRLRLDEPDRIWSRADCAALFHRILGFTTGGGQTSVTLRSTWTAHLRWARNRPSTSGDTLALTASITRVRQGRRLTSELDQCDDTTLQHAVQTLEERLAALPAGQDGPDELLPPQHYLVPPLWSDATYDLTPQERSAAARHSVDPVVAAKRVAAGDLSVCAATWAIFNTHGLESACGDGRPVCGNRAESSGDGLRVGWPDPHGLGQAGCVPLLSANGLAGKCLAPRPNPRAIEPGRYTTILEAEAVAFLMNYVVSYMDRAAAESRNPFQMLSGVTNPYYLSPGQSTIRKLLRVRPAADHDPHRPDGSRVWLYPVR